LSANQLEQVFSEVIREPVGVWLALMVVIELVGCPRIDDVAWSVCEKAKQQKFQLVAMADVQK